MLTELALPRPEHRRRISTLEVLQGGFILPIDRVNLMSSAEYEVFIREWADEYLSKKYVRVRSFAGAGDKGRDVVGY